jgi:hypothetical protein
MTKTASCWLAGIVLFTLPLAAQTFKPQQKRWWAIQPVVKPAVPALDEAGKAWARNEIDAFVWDKLKSKSLAPSTIAAKTTYLRRVSLGLTGLPPTPEEMQQFLSDNAPGAEERLVDRLLASPRYGERWGRHWLDVVRYADSDGFKEDGTRPDMWRYRDWVIQSFNEDKPYNRFVREQIAADELYPNDRKALTGLGYLRLFEDEYNQAHIRMRRQELLNDVTDNTAYAFMGVTLACARCHDHKFDPLLHKDYYRLQAFFSNMRIDDEATTASPAEVADYEAKMAKYREAAKPVLDKIATLVEPAQKAFRHEYTVRFPDEVQDVLKKPEAERSPLDWQVFHKAIPQVMVTDDYAMGKKGTPAQKAEYKQLQGELAAFKHLLPAPLPRVQVMRDQAVEAPATHVLRAGALEARMDEVQPGWLSILDPEPAKVTARADLKSSGRRTALAEILSDPKNPLTTRTIVNRVWHYHFGRGIVASPNDFGVMGERPTHRELLDWLTASFVGEDGWSIKKLHKRIVLSSTYRQSSEYRADAAKADDQNKLLWRYPRRRLEAEPIRDSMLYVSGLLDPTMGGPGVFPAVPEGTEINVGRHWKARKSEADENRASIYIFARRLVRYPMLQSFDAPLAFESCGRRQETVTPDQALELMNGSAAARMAKALAMRVANDAGQTSEALVERATKLVLGRAPSPAESERGVKLLASGPRQETLEDLCLALLSTSEFLYVD